MNNRTERIVAKNRKRWESLGWSQSKMSHYEKCIRKNCGQKRPTVSKRMKKIVESGEFNLYEKGNRFEKGFTPWNKGKKVSDIPWNKGKHISPEASKKLSKSLKKAYAEGRCVQWAKGKTKETDKRIWNTTQSKSRNKKISTVLKEKYKDDEYKKMAVERSFRSVYSWRFPNKSEKKLLKFLNKHFNDEWLYVGDWKLIISGCNPDFVNMNGKKLIEFFGDYWHKPEDEEFRIKHFRKDGYDTLVIWEHELKDMDKIKEKVQNYYYT